MKRIKRCLLIFCVFLVVAASLFPCSASLADEGYLWDDEGGFWYIPKSEAADDETITRRSGPLRAPAASGTGTTIAFPDFDKNKIDVAGFPDYVKKLLASRTSLVWLIVGSKHLYIWVADGCIPAVSTSYGKLFLLNLKLSNARVNSVDTFFYPDDKSVFNTIPSDFICYSAKYSWNKSSDLYTNVVNDWSVAAGKKIVRYVSSTEASSVGSSFYAYYLPNRLYTATTDFYVYGNAKEAVIEWGQRCYNTSHGNLNKPEEVKFYAYGGFDDKGIPNYVTPEFDVFEAFKSMAKITYEDVHDYSYELSDGRIYENAVVYSQGTIKRAKIIEHEEFVEIE